MARRTKRKTATIHVLPGIERRDLTGDVPEKAVLSAAIKQGVTDVIIIGRDRQGQRYIATSMSDMDQAVGRIITAANYLASATVVQE